MPVIWQFPEGSRWTRIESGRLPGVWLIARVDGCPLGSRNVEEDPEEA